MNLSWAARGFLAAQALAAACLLCVDQGLGRECAALRRRDRGEFEERRRIEHELTERVRSSAAEAEWLGTYADSRGSLVLHAGGRFELDRIAPSAECFFDRDRRPGTWWVEGEDLLLWPDGTRRCDSFRCSRKGCELTLSGSTTTWRRHASR